MTMLRRLAAVTTFASLAAAIGASLVWALVADGQARFEPAIQTLAQVAALTGIVAGRFAAQRQRRRHALATLTGELLANRAILDELLSTLNGAHARRRVYPRLVLSVAEGTIVSGTLADDPELLVRLHEWHNGAVDFNRRLDLTEMLTFLQGAPEAIRRFEQALSQDGGRVRRTSRLLDDFIAYLDRSAARKNRHTPAYAAFRASETRHTPAYAAFRASQTRLTPALPHSARPRTALRPRMAHFVRQKPAIRPRMAGPGSSPELS